MKKVLVTGLNGRLGPYLKNALEVRGVQVVPFNREQLDIGNHQQQYQYIKEANVDAICHLAMGSDQWVSILADIAKELSITFLYTSTESVFDPSSKGPFTENAVADATGEYGTYKITCEKAALESNQKVIIARLGWQMFDTFDNNNLLTHVQDMHNEKGYLEASTKWYPAVAFVDHTMQAIIDLLTNNNHGTYNIGGNEARISFYELVNLINAKYHKDWDIRKSSEPSRDGRIIDSRVPCGSIVDALR